MKSKKENLLEEKERNLKMISFHSKHLKRLEERNEVIDAEVESIKFREYGEVAKAFNLEPEQLAELLNSLKRKEKTDEE